MKKIIVTVLILLLLPLTSPSIPKASATSTKDFRVTPALPDDVPREPISTNFTTGDYLNTTNPFIQGNPLDEIDEEEGSKPLYVLVFGDEEERDVLRSFPWDENYVLRLWWEWAECQLERGDEALVTNFGIDIRILGFEEWDSNDSLNSMADLWGELEADTEPYLRQWYNGECWSNYVDAIIGITAQETPGDPTAGYAPGDDLLNQGRIFILLHW